jgi:hypothetical protein
MELVGLKYRALEMSNVPAVHVRDHVDLGLCGCDLLLGRELGAAAEEERHVVYAVLVRGSKVYRFCGDGDFARDERVEIWCC